jgi:hypothetical protein
MIDKIKNILGSIRFYQLVLAGIIYLLGFYGVLPDEVAKSVIAILLGSVTIDTADKLGKNIGASGK